jgi:glycosyltransferase involved in cell wall biosynthesis
MKIVLLSDRIPPENVGGAGRVAWILAGGLRRIGHDVQVIAATEKNTFHDVRDGIKCYHLHVTPSERWAAWRGVYSFESMPLIRKLIEQIKPDVVNAHNVHGALSWWSLVAARSAGSPVVFTAHDLMSVAYTKLTHFIQPDGGIGSYRLPPLHNLRQMRLRYNPFRNALIKRILLKQVSRRVCVGETQRQALAENGLPGFEVVRNGIDVSAFRSDPQAVRDFQARYENRPLVLFAGRLSGEKGAYLLLDAWRIVHQQRPDARLLCLGPDALITPILRDYADLRDKGSVIAGGWLQGRDLIAAYHASVMVVAPSIFLESMPMVALEGMAASKPLIVSPYGGLPELVKADQTGFIVSPFDRTAFAEKLLFLLNHPEQAAGMGRQGREWVEDQFPLALQVAEMERIFHEVQS